MGLNKIVTWIAAMLTMCTFLSCETPVETTDLQKIASDFNQKGPQMIDSETRIDGIQIKDSNTVVYNYTLINLLSQNVDTNEFKRELKPGIISVIKVSPEMKKLRDANTNFEYRYQDRENKFIYLFRITPADYQ